VTDVTERSALAVTSLSIDDEIKKTGGEGAPERLRAPHPNTHSRACRSRWTGAERTAWR